MVVDANRDRTAKVRNPLPPVVLTKLLTYLHHRSVIKLKLTPSLKKRVRDELQNTTSNSLTVQGICFSYPAGREGIQS